MITTDSPTLCVAVVVRDPAGRVLLLCRGLISSFPRRWCLPGGRVEFGEHPERTAFRDLQEETGLVVQPASLRLLPLVTSRAAGGKHLVGIIYEALAWTGEPRNAEPDRHDTIGWFGLDELPGPMMPGAAETLQYLNEQRP